MPPVAHPGISERRPPLRCLGRTRDGWADRGTDPGEWADAWNGSLAGHHRAPGTDHSVPEPRAAACLTGPEPTEAGG